MDEEQVYHIAMTLWGIQAQEDKFLEECAEVMDALFKNRKYKRERPDMEDHLVKELVDIHIMTNQIAKFYNWELFIEYKQQKLEELEEKFKESRYGRFILEFLGLTELKGDSNE